MMTIGERITSGGVVWECVDPGRVVGPGEWCFHDSRAVFWNSRSALDYPILRPVAIEGAGVESQTKDRVDDWLRGFRDCLNCVMAEVEK